MPRTPRIPPQITIEDSPNNQFSAAMQIVLSGIQESLQHVSDAIYGNGTEGLRTLTAGNSQSIEEIKKMITSLTTSIGNLTQAVSDLTISVDRHHHSLHMEDIIKKPAFWIILILGLGALHSVYTYSPGFFISIINGLFHTSFAAPPI